MAIKWLMENAEAVVRYRTQIELMDINKKEQLQENLTAVLALPQTLKRMDMLRNMNYSRVHGSDSTHLENILPMLSDFGLHYGVDAVRLIIKDNLDLDSLKFFYKKHPEATKYGNLNLEGKRSHRSQGVN